jgi:hypothetical protein
VPDTPLNDRPPLVLRGAYIDAGALFPITVISGQDGTRPAIPP